MLHEPKANDSSEEDDNLLSSTVHHSDFNSSLKMENKYLSSVDSGEFSFVNHKRQKIIKVLLS